MKKVLSLLLSVLMVISIIPISGVSAEAASTISNGVVITLGSYPQSKVTDSAVISQLNNKSKTWKSYRYMESKNTPGDYMKYCDIDLDGDGCNDYRGVQFSIYRPYCTILTASSTFIAGTYQGANGYSLNTVYWFRYEPLTWRVLDAETGLVMCESIIDAQAYNDYEYSGYADSAQTAYINKWETSSIRSWLNDTFYNTAFSADDKTHIVLSTISNRGYGDYYNYADTQDNIFLLSYDDVLNENYGFCSSNETYDTARRAQGTDYAKSQGLFLSTYTPSYGNSNWRLRSAGSGSDVTCSVYHTGNVNYRAWYTNHTNYGVRPALCLNLSSIDCDYPYMSFYGGYDLITYDMVKNNGFYQYSDWENEGYARYFAFNTWDYIENIGETISFKFDNLTITGNIYDAFVSDLLLLMYENKTTTNGIDNSVTKTMNSMYSNTKNLLKNTSEWEKYTDKLGFENSINKFLFTNPVAYEPTEEVKNFLSDLYKNAPYVFNGIFSGFSWISTALNYLNAGTDFYNCFVKVYYASIVASALIESEDEFYETIEGAISEMKAIDSTSAKYAEKLESVIEKRKQERSEIDVFEETLNSFDKNLFKFSYSYLLKDIFKTYTCKIIANIFGVSTITPFMAISSAWNLTTAVTGNILTGLDAKKKPYYCIYLVAPFEEGLRKYISGLDSHFRETYKYTAGFNAGSEEAKKDCDDYAESLYYAMQIWANTNIYLYNKAISYDSASKNGKESLALSSAKNNYWEKVIDNTLKIELITYEMGVSGHKWDGGIEMSSSTCTNNGVKYYTCTFCGKTKTESVAKTAHVWNKGEIITEPTTETKGMKTYTCTVCGKTKTVMIQKLSLIKIETENVVETETGVAYGNEGTSVSEILNAVSGATITTKAGKEVSGDSALCNGMVVTKPDGTTTTIIVKGDIDCDGDVSVSDARLALRTAINLQNYDNDSVEYIAAHIENTEKVGVSDARLILRAAVDLEKQSDWNKA